jgi:hypothetical protein
MLLEITRQTPLEIAPKENSCKEDNVRKLTANREILVVIFI